MADKTSIFNAALNKLPVQTVTSDTEVSVAAETLSRLWDDTRKELLRQKNWSFATVIQELNVSSVTPPSEWVYAYVYPPKAVEVFKVYNSVFIASPLLRDDVFTNPLFQPITDVKNYLKFGEPFRKLFDPATNALYLASNCQSASVEYVYDVPDPSIWDASFVEVMTWLLASKAAMPLTGDQNLALAMATGYTNALSIAKKQDANENTPERFGGGSTVDSRT